MVPSITQEIFTRFVNGTASAAEVAAVQAWLAQPENELPAYYRMQQHWEELAATPPTAAGAGPNYELMLSQLHARLGWATPAMQPARPRWHGWAAAATLSGLLVGGGWELQARLPRAKPLVAPVAVATSYGQQRVLNLPDGTQVTLNGHSTLHYAAATWGMAQHPREVWLDGEAYFAVKHRPNNQRFVVHTTAGFKIEVLGTKFTVYRRHTQGRVVLLSGKVRLDFDDQRRADVIMRPGELVEIHDNAPLAPVAPRAVHTAPYATWKDEMLVLDETTISDLATRLQDTYGVTVVVQTPALNQRKVSGTVPVRDLDLLLQALKESFHLHATRQANHITLSE